MPFRSNGARPVATELRPDTTSSAVTHGPSRRASARAPTARSTPKHTKEPFISACRGEQYAAAQPTSPSRLTESATKL